MNKRIAGAMVATVIGCVGASASGQTVVWSNTAGGDAFSDPTLVSPGASQAVGATGFYYNNVRGNGVAGINSTYARSGNGSAFLSTPSGSGKADIEYIPGTALGTLSSLSSLSYDWYRDSSSTNAAVQHPAIRLLVTNGVHTGGLVFEQAYNGSNVPTDSWVTEDIFSYNGGNGANLWTYGAGMTFAEEGYGNTLADWVGGVGTIDGDWVVYGISMGVGSGWSGEFEGAVDNLVIGFDGVETEFNFETLGSTVIPLPSAAGMAFAGIGLIGLRRRR
ncbi:MAG: hypothetical protein ACF8MJ_01650 [Phycisphaerales bacterium JB050]